MRRLLPSGFQSRTIRSWIYVNDALSDRSPKMIVHLSCYSPSEIEKNIFGFPGKVDAEAGALLAAWRVLHSVNPRQNNVKSLYRVPELQVSMAHPLDSYVYFLHGYYGRSSDFDNMKDALIDWNVHTRYDEFRDFSYWEPYWELLQGQYETEEDLKQYIHWFLTVFDYAADFASMLINDHGNQDGVQIDIVAHSMGGIITRELLRSWRNTLSDNEIEIGRVITLASPHQGTNLASSELAIIYLQFLDIFYDFLYWATPTFWSMAPDSVLMTLLNIDPMSYSSGIEWYTVSGVDNPFDPWYNILGLLHLDTHDKLVATGRAHLDFAEQVILPFCDHDMIRRDIEVGSFDYIESWLQGEIDTDSDTITDVEELHLYGTNPYLADSDTDDISDSLELFTYYTNPLLFDTDGDSLGDGDELWVHGTNPLAWSTDGDVLSDGQEIDWEYDPFDTDDPIDADHLTHSAWQVGGTTGYVRANHYEAMSYVIVYVRYSIGPGNWKPYNYVGTDSTPYYYGDYYMTWSIQQGYAQMQVKVEAYDSSSNYLGCDTQIVAIPGGGGGPPIT